MHRIVIAVIIAASAALAPQASLGAPEKYGFDKNHSHIQFAIQHLGISTFLGQFNDFDGTVVFDSEDPSKSTVDLTIKAGSIDTDVEALDKHLRSPDFFEVEKYPVVTFKSVGVQQTSKDTYRIVGNLNMHGQTREVAIDAKFNFSGTHPLSEVSDSYKGAHYAGFSATASIIRSAFGMDYAIPNLADQVDLRLEIELRRQEGS